MDSQLLQFNPSFDADRVLTKAERYSCILSLIRQSVEAGYFNGDWQSAVEMTDSLAQLGDLDSCSRLIRAKALIELRRFDDALEGLIETAAKDTWCGATQVLLGEARLQIKRYKDASRSFANAIGLKAMTGIIADDTVAFIGRAIAFTFMGRLNAAASDMNMYSMLRPLQKAREHYWSGRHSQCSLYLETLTPRVRALPAAQYLKVRNTMVTGDYALALEEFPNAISTSYTTLPLLYCRALCNFKTENFEACIVDLSKIAGLAGRVVFLEANPIARQIDLIDICQILEMRAYCYKQLKNYASAVSDYEAVLECSPRPETYLARAQALYPLGFVVRALADLDQAESSLAAHPDFMSLKMLCLTRLQRGHEAATMANSILLHQPDHELAKKTLTILGQSEFATAPSLQPSL